MRLCIDIEMGRPDCRNYWLIRIVAELALAFRGDSGAFAASRTTAGSSPGVPPDSE
jgi:hypothetical protein